MMPRSCPVLARPLAAALLFALIPLLAAGCGRRETPPPPARPDTSARAARGDSTVGVDSAARTDSPITGAAHPAPAFTRIALPHAKHAMALRDSLGPERWRQVLKLNRVDDAHVRQGDSLIVPLAWGDSLALSPFPRTLDAVRDTARLLLVSIRLQAFAAYDSGRLVRWGPVSTGRKEKPTPVGLYHTNWKDRVRISSIDDAWVMPWYVNIDNAEGVSIHQYDLPGRPVSHSCVRLLEPDARWVYDHIQPWLLAPDHRTILRHGTPVVVFGAWRYGQRQPWKYLPERPDAATITADDLADALHILTAHTRPDFSTIPPDPLEAPKRPLLKPDSAMAPDYSFDTLRVHRDSTALH